ncbi:MAG: endonuclease [Gelidibacter sp.]
MSSESHIHTIAFYNTENLFDVFADERTNDNDFLPISAKNWTQQRYEKKIYKLGSVISKIGFESIQKPPVLVGLAEVENDTVLQDLIGGEDLKSYNYGFVHYDSPDERGIDVALLYNKDEFEVESSKAFPIYIEDESGKRDFTRDILLVTGCLNNHKIHVLVNHWPSRHEGKDETDYKRIIAAAQLSEIISYLTNEDSNTQIVVMGDFNDNPNSQSIMNLKNDNGLYNTMEAVWSYSRGSVNHNFAWIQFDQIFLTHNFVDKNDMRFKLIKADIFDEKFLTQYNGKFKGQPYRTYVGKKYKGGFSDHFPVYIQIRES